ncbi:MAG: TonB-dependent receptor [Spirochaetia bacterium]|nr:TonB-dependent receptor [Spirochaetia bacterium]
MKRTFLSMLLVLTAAAAVFAFGSDYNGTAAQYSSGGSASTVGQQTGTEPAAGVTRKPNTSGVYEWEPARPAGDQQTQVRAQATAGVTQVDEVVVTARRITEKISFVPKHIDVILPKPEMKLVELPDILEKIAGFEILKYGGYEAVAGVSIRGAPSGHTLVLVNGIPVNDIMTGTADLNMLSVSDISKIEVIKGGMSAIYGMEGSSGVINMLTGSKENKLLRASVAYGSFETLKYSLASHYQIYGVKYSAGVVEDKSAGYKENSDYFKRSADLKLAFTGDTTDTQIYGNYLKRETGVTTTARQYDENYGVGSDFTAITGPVNVKISGFMKSEDLTYISGGTWSSVSRHKKKEYQGRMDIIYDENEFFSGLTSYEADFKSVTSTNIGYRDMLNHSSVSSATTKYLNGDLVINTSFRADFNSHFANTTSESLSGKYKLPENIIARASFEKSLRAPAFGELYWPTEDWGSFVMTGNPGLRPEDTTSYEIVIEKSDTGIKESLAWFKNDIKNLISWKSTYEGITETSRPVNIDAANIWGLEAKVDFDPSESMNISACYTFMKAADGNGDKLLYRPESTAEVEVTYKFPFETVIKVDARYTDIKLGTRSVNFVSEIYVMKPYFLMDVSAAHKLSENVKVSVEAGNVLNNTEYEVMPGYQMPGRNINANITVEF